MFCLGVLTCNVVLPGFEHDYNKYICFAPASNVHYAFVFFDIFSFVLFSTIDHV